MGNTRSALAEKEATTGAAPPELPVPKHLLWGCETTKEHYDYYDHAVQIVASRHSLEGLQALKLEYRLVQYEPDCHCDFHSDNVKDNDNDNDYTNDDEKNEKDEANSNGDGDQPETIKNLDGDDHENENDNDNDFSIGGYESDTNDNERDNMPEQEKFNFDEDQQGFFISVRDDDKEEKDEQEELPEEVFMVPIGTSIKEHIRKSQSNLIGLRDEGNHKDEGGNHNDNNSTGLSIVSSSLTAAYFSERRVDSSVSLFSLATHHSARSSQSGYSRATSTTSDGNGDGDGDDISEAPRHPCHRSSAQCCDLRLFHIPSDTMVTELNHKSFIAHGALYEEVARLCMEFSHDLMIQVGNLEWITICPQRGIRALMSRPSSSSTASTASATEQQPPEERQPPPPTLLIVTGKGKVGAGIFSRRLLLTQGVESSTALWFVRQATRRNMRIVLLDPNCLGPQRAMEVFETSIDAIFFSSTTTTTPPTSTTIATTSTKSNNDHHHHNNNNYSNKRKNIYVLAHSMAGSQLVRYFLNKHDKKTSSTTNNASSSSNTTTDHKEQFNSISATTMTTAVVDPHDYYLSHFQAVAFTDSNHNINWVNRKIPALADFFQGPQCLYIKSHKVHSDTTKLLGEVHHDCTYWKHRFGTIHTLWAGTHEHALTNHAARFPIWDHWTKHMEEEDELRQQQDQQTV